MKEKSAKAGPHLNTKRWKIIITEETHHFNIDNETLKQLQILLTLVQSSVQMEPRNRRRLRLRRAAKEELGPMTKSKDVSLETKTKVIHTLVFPDTMSGCES